MSNWNLKVEAHIYQLLIVIVCTKTLMADCANIPIAVGFD